MNTSNKLRVEAYNKLERMMNYPGRFPILVLGDTGTGKTHSIMQIIKTANEFRGEFEIINGGLIQETKLFWDELLKSADNKFLIVKDVEKLTNKSQEFLFDALSTIDGKYGFVEKKLVIRIIFTTTFPISKIRDDRRYLSARFFDRISQFVVEFPNFDKTQRNIYEDFKATWEKMFLVDGKLLQPCPASKELINWLESEAYRMYGNFRDLDKIVINWHLCQLQEELNGKNVCDKEVELMIFSKIKNDFKIYLHNPSQRIYDDNTYVFVEGFNYGDHLNNFRKQLKNWILALHNNNKSKAADELNISYRTMERWK
ncbi:MAG: ATP-binding protein [Paludibacter sp.]